MVSPHQNPPPETASASSSLGKAESSRYSGTKLSRTSTPKVRTGCITCKKRRVKCDESKPHCLKCLNGRRECEGYDVAPGKIYLIPKPGQHIWNLRRTTHNASPIVQLQLDPDHHDFNDAASKLYFQEFVCMMQDPVPWVATISNSDLWDVILPQLARNISTIRHAAIAIGALCTWYRQTKNEIAHIAAMPASPGADGDEHYFNAVAHYCYTIRLQNQQNSVPDALLLSVLLLTFEILRGNRKAALDHVNHGLTLLLTLLADKDANHYVAALGPNPKPVLGAVAGVLGALAPQACAILPGRIGQCMPLPNFTKGLKVTSQTIESFIALLDDMPCRVPALDRMPAEFTNLDEFQEYSIAAQQKITPLGPIMVQFIRDSGVLTSNDEGAIHDFWLKLLEHPQISKLCESRTQLMLDLDSAFLPLFNKIIMSDANPRLYLRAVHLRLQHFGAYVFNNPLQYIVFETVNSRTSLFREYLSIADIALRTAKREIYNPAHHVSLQRDLAWRLFTVAFFCRDPQVREDALGKLKDYRGQDGLWNSRSLYILALRNRAVERVNATEGTSTEQWRRLWRREYVFEDSCDRVVFRFQDKETVTGTWQFVEEVAYSHGKSDDVQWERQALASTSNLMLLADLYSSRADVMVDS